MGRSSKGQEKVEKVSESTNEDDEFKLKFEFWEMMLLGFYSAMNIIYLDRIRLFKNYDLDILLLMYISKQYPFQVFFESEKN